MEAGREEESWLVLSSLAGAAGWAGGETVAGAAGSRQS